jgi:hypothetical protein
MLHAVTTSDSKLYWIVISNYEMASSSGTVAENSTQNANSEGSNPIAGEKTVISFLRLRCINGTARFLIFH